MITVGSIYWTLETEEVLNATEGNKASPMPCTAVLGCTGMSFQCKRTLLISSGHHDGQVVPEEQSPAWGSYGISTAVFGRVHPLVLRIQYRPCCCWACIRVYVLALLRLATQGTIIVSFARCLCCAWCKELIRDKLDKLQRKGVVALVTQDDLLVVALAVTRSHPLRFFKQAVE